MISRKIAQSVVLVAIVVALSPFHIPVGISKCYPVQHMVNVIGAVMLGPVYTVAVATIAGILRNILGIGTLLAFPGGMIGALLAGLAYRKFKNIYWAALGEIIGTGLLGSLTSAWIVAPLLMGKNIAVAVLVVAFSVSTLGGTILGIIALQILKKAGVWKP